MENYSARCDYDHTLLFEVPNFEAFHEPSPVILTCRGGCGRSFEIFPTPKGRIGVIRHGSKKRIRVNVAPSGEA